MTVSRSGKHGTRAGGKNMRPTSRNRRVIVNARLANVTKALDERPTAQRTSKEQWVINCVTRVVGTRGGEGFVTADDTASDIILALLDAGGFNWEEDEIERFCRQKASYMVLRYLGRRERNECEFTVEGADGEIGNMMDLFAVQRAMQEIAIEASQARELLPLLPTRHRVALEILCDGGNPIEVAEEFDIPPWEAITLIKQAREYIGRVGPLDEAA